MYLEGAFPTPNFRQYSCSAKIDFVTIHSPTPLCPAVLKHYGANVPRNPKRYVYPHVATLHNATPKKVAMLARLCPEARVTHLEVAIDLTPKWFFMGADRAQLMKIAHDFVLARLYPWDAPGIQVAIRASRARGQNTFLLPYSLPKTGVDVTDVATRMAFADEITYFGHRDGEHVMPGEDHFAEMRVYRKATDNKKPLAPKWHRVRAEVSINQAGCEHFGVKTLPDLFGFDFRRLAPYFRLVAPAIKPFFSPQYARTEPLLAAAAKRTIDAWINRAMVAAGSSVLAVEPLARLGYGHQHAEGNRKVGDLLGSLGRAFKSCKWWPPIAIS